MFAHRSGRQVSLAIVVASILVSGCGKNENPAAKNDPTVGRSSPALTTQGVTGAPTSPAKPDFSLTADEYDLEWQKDSAAAKYEGKVIELKGAIAGLGLDGDGNAWISLKTGNNIPGTEIKASVVCKLSDKDPWGKLGYDQSVKVRGRGFGYNTALLDSVIVEAGPNPSKAISAVDLANQFAADRSKMTDDKKPLIVEGEIIGKTDRILYLKGDGKLRVACYFNEDGFKVADRFKEGQSVRIMARLLPLRFDDQGPALACDALTSRPK
jgi:hypothetical protein